jgi:hypothetical protein
VRRRASWSIHGHGMHYLPRGHGRIDSSDAAAPRAVQRIRCLGNCGRGLSARVPPINFREELP